VLAWIGLEQTTAYQDNVVKKDKERFKKEVNDREKNIYGNKSWHGSPCP